MIEGAAWRRWVFFYLPLAAFVFLLLFPFYWMAVTAVRPDAELYRPWNAPNYAPFWTANPTLEHIRFLLDETLFSTWMWNTMLIALLSTAISLFCGILAGYALARLNFPFAGSLGTGIFITYLVPQTLLFIPLADIIRNFKLGDSPWALILTYPTFLIPFCTWLMMGYFKTIPKELEECARIDGATRLKAMIYIVLPIAVPGILSAGIFAFTLSWNEFIYALVFGILAGYALARLRFTGAAILGLAVFISYLVPQTLLFIPMFDVIKSLNIGDTYWALILTYPTFLIPFCTALLMGYFKSIPRELEESALIDGSSRLRAIIEIVLPLAMPGILSAGIFAFTLSWNEFIYALVFITTTPMKTLPVGVVNELIRGDVFFWGSLMAGALLGSVPVALIYSFFVEYYVAGLTAGAVKG